jgi:hypothetical protein
MHRRDRAGKGEKLPLRHFLPQVATACRSQAFVQRKQREDIVRTDHRLQNEINTQLHVLVNNPPELNIDVLACCDYLSQFMSAWLNHVSTGFNQCDLWFRTHPSVNLTDLDTFTGALLNGRKDRPLLTLAKSSFKLKEVCSVIGNATRYIANNVPILVWDCNPTPQASAANVRANILTTDPFLSPLFVPLLPKLHTLVASIPAHELAERDIAISSVVNKTLQPCLFAAASNVVGLLHFKTADSLLMKLAKVSAFQDLVIQSRSVVGAVGRSGLVGEDELKVCSRFFPYRLVRLADYRSPLRYRACSDVGWTIPSSIAKKDKNLASSGIASPVSMPKHIVLKPYILSSSLTGKCPLSR